LALTTIQYMKWLVRKLVTARHLRVSLTDTSSKHLPVRLVACDLVSEAGIRLRPLRAKACANIA